MLVATDPLSGVSVRQQVTVSTPGEGSKDFFARFDLERGFIIISAVLAAFLGAVLVVLVGQNNKRGEQRPWIPARSGLPPKG